MIKTIEESKLMTAYMLVSAYIDEMFEEKVLVAFNNKEECIHSIEGDIVKLNVKVGQKVLKGSAAYECMEKEKSIHKIIPKEVFGLPYKVHAFPIREEGKVIGCISICRSLSKQNAILDISENIENRMSDINEIVSQIAESVKETSIKSEEINQKSNSVKSEVDGTDQILSMVKGITAQNRLLSLNATIEAARVGEAGRGFAVVAREMGNLSKTSKESLQEIEATLASIKVAFTDIIGRYSYMNDGFGEQVTSLEEISEAIKNLNKTTTELRKMAEKM